jgi:MYXO-CTERM domain-containing protein
VQPLERDRACSCALFVVIALAPSLARGQTPVAPGITLYEPERAHVVVVELDHPDVTFAVTEPELRGRTVSEVAGERGAVVALNGGPFSLEGFAPSGLTVGGGRSWAGSADDGAHTLLAVDIDGCGGVYRAAPWIARERWMDSAVAGTAIVVADGVGVEPARCTGAACSERAQSAVGLSADGRLMVLAAADAATPRAIGDLLASHGAWVGMLLDGGSSTAMVVDGSVVNTLADGVERRVASHLTVYSGRSPRAWDVRGLVIGQPVVDVEVRTFWDAQLDANSTVPASGGEDNDGLFQFMPVPFRNVRIVTPDRCLFTGFTGPEDLQLLWTVDEGATCPPAECTRVADAWAVTEPACPADASVEGGAAAIWALGLAGVALAAVLRRRG